MRFRFVFETLSGGTALSANLRFLAKITVIAVNILFIRAVINL